MLGNISMRGTDKYERHAFTHMSVGKLSIQGGCKLSALRNKTIR